MARVVLVTGVSRDLGAKFARTLAADDSYEVIGVDVTPPRHELGRAAYVRADIRNPVIVKVIGERDVEMARDLVRQDDVVDNLNKEIFRIALEIGDDHDRREWAMTMILVARAIERIGDNAVDIGEQVAFIVTGLFREFQDASHPGEPIPH